MMSALPPNFPPIGPSLEEADDFLEKVNEATRLIEGLKSGSIPPEYIDRKQRAKEEEAEKKEAESVQQAQDDVKKREETMRKVEEIKMNLMRKNKARERYARYLDGRQGGAGQGKIHRFATDYTAWDLWTPSDEEDDMLRDLPPNTPEFRAMEKDVNDRHKRMTEQRQLAERCRVKGNDALKRGQVSEAYGHYTEGLSAQKTNMALHGNAALASIKMGCYVQAIEHCDKVLQLDEFLHDGKTTKDPVVVKALQRRAAARGAMGHWTEAVRDLEAALEREPGDKEIVAQLERARADQEEARRERQVAARAKKAAEDASAAGAAPAPDAEPQKGFDPLRRGGKGKPAAAGTTEADAEAASLRPLRDVERLVQQLRAGSEASASGQPGDASGATKGGAPGVAAACKKLGQAVRSSDECCVYARQCGALPLLTMLAASASAPPPDRVAALQALEACCLNNRSAEEATNPKEANLGGVGAAILASKDSPVPVRTAAANLLYLCAVDGPVRKRIAKALTSAAGAVTQVLHLMTSDASTDSGLQAVAAATALLSQLAVEPEVRAAIRDAMCDSDAASAAAALDAVVGPLRSTQPFVVERGASLLGNMFGDAEVRKRACEDARVLAGLLKASGAAAVGEGSSTGKAAVPASAAALGAQSAALAALVNLSLEPPAADRLVALRAVRGLSVLLSSPMDPVAESRCWSILARLARHKEAPKLFTEAGLIDKAAAVLRGDPAALEGDSAAAAAKDLSVDAAVRCLALLAASDPGSRPLIVSSGAAAALAEVVSREATPDGPVANGALCLGDIARDAGLIAGLPVSLIDGLCRVAHKRRHAPAAQKNAAIALGRLAQHPPFLERLRELRGLEIIHAYVKL